MTLMEYLIKTGSERVAQQCRENIYAVQTLKDFQFIDRDGKDQVRRAHAHAHTLYTHSQTHTGTESLLASHSRTLQCFHCDLLYKHRVKANSNMFMGW